jgi:multidrug efflux pump subunit AcrB
MIELLFKQRRAINLFFMVLFVLGLLSLNKLGTAELPEPPRSGLSVTAILPGASPEEIDQKVARLLQNAIKDVSGVEKVSSRSGESQVNLSVQFVDEHKDKDALAREVTQIINQVPNLPAELEGPFVFRPSNRIFPAMTLILAGGDDLERHKAWHEIEQVLRNVKQIEHIETLGDRDRRVEIQLDPMKLQQLGVRIDQVSGIIQQAFSDQSAGRMETFLFLNRIRVKAQPKTLAELSAIPIKIGNNTLPLGYIADIQEVLAPERLRVTHDGKKAWYINIYRRTGSKIADLSSAAKQVIKKVNLQFVEQKQDLRLTIIQDRSVIVDRVLGELGNAIILGMLLVLLVLWCFFGFHNALYAAIGIPFSFVATFIAMDIMGIGLNTFTLFGLVLVCGMIVDDSIVVLENIYSKLEQGLDTAKAIKQGMAEVMPAVLASTGTTVAAFLPLLLMTGGMGDFISQIPKVAILALVASLVECFVILPIHIYNRRHKSAKTESFQLNSFKQNVFNRTIDKLANRMSQCVSRLLLMPYRVLTTFVGLLVLTGALAYFTMDFKLFDADEVRSIRVHLTFAKTSDLAMTSQLMEHKRSALEAVPLVKDLVILNGWSDYNYRQQNRSHLATIELLLAKEAYESDNANKVSLQVEKILNSLPGLEKLQIVQEKSKPPAEIPVVIYLYGNDTRSLALANANVIQQLKMIPSINNISNQMEDGISELVFDVNEEMAAHYGLQAKEIGQLLHMTVTGQKIAKLDRGDEIVDVYVLEEKSSDWRSSKINHLTLSDGQVIPIEQLGTFTKKLAPDVVKRYQGNRYVAITADIDTSILSSFNTHRQIEQAITDDLLPEGVSFEQLGEFSQSQKSLTSMYQSALLSLGLVYLILAVLFRSYVQPLIVLLTIPLAYMGVIWGMSLMGRDISLFGLVGIIGLIGIVVNDSLVWVSCYNQLKSGQLKSKSHLEDSKPSAIRCCREAAVAAVKLRFRPIMLTTITTVFGLLPVALSKSAGIAGSMASTVVSGLLAASILLLVFLPVCVVIIDDLNNRFAELDRQSYLNKIAAFFSNKKQQKLNEMEQKF